MEGHISGVGDSARRGAVQRIHASYELMSLLVKPPSAERPIIDLMSVTGGGGGGGLAEPAHDLSALHRNHGAPWHCDTAKASCEMEEPNASWNLCFLCHTR